MLLCMEVLNELALFAGAGGGILGGHLLGWRTVCAVECNAYAASVLVARQNDGCLPPFPIWDDVRTFDGQPWRGRVDVVSGGFPCQDISSAGKGAGIEGSRSGLWAEMARIVREVGPRFVLVENSPLLTGRGLHVVLGDLAAMGYDARWGVLGAVDAGAPHKRERIWVLADAEQDGRARRATHVRPGALAQASNAEAGAGDLSTVPATHSGADVADPRSGNPCGGVEHTDTPHMADPDRFGRERRTRPSVIMSGRGEPANGDWWSHEPDVGRMADGVASRVDRLACLGNGQVPAVAALAWRRLSEC